MENIFEKLDLSGIEKAIMEDKCAAEIYYREIPNSKKVMLIKKNDEHFTVVGYGDAITVISVLVEASNDYLNKQNDIENKTFPEGKKEVFCLLDLQLSKYNTIFIEKENNKFKVSLKDSEDNVLWCVGSEELANALNCIDTYVLNLSKADIVSLYKNCLRKIDPKYIPGNEPSYDKGVQRRKKLI